MSIAFLGLGNVGRPLAHNLLRAGHMLRVHDPDKERAAPLIADGAEWCASATECVRGVSHLITSLPSPAVSREVMEGIASDDSAGDAKVTAGERGDAAGAKNSGEAKSTKSDAAGDDGGVLSALERGAIWIEMSTTDIDEVVRLGAVAAVRGIGMLEAPVTGGCHRAASGEITILAGGERATFDACLPLLQIMGGEIHYMGKLGNASVLKVVSNMLAFLNLVGLGEGLMLCRRAGLDLNAVYHALKASSGNSFVHETETQVILSGSYNIGFTMDLACKDLRLALELGRKYDVPLDLGTRLANVFADGREKLGERAWSTAVVKLLEDACGQDLRCAGFPETLD